MDYYQAGMTRRGVAWGCSVHRTPRGIECEWCDRQTELFTRATVVPAPRLAGADLTPCGGCGLYPDEHCRDCGLCPDWHEVDCTYAPLDGEAVALPG